MDLVSKKLSSGFPSSGFPTSLVLNHPTQLQRLAGVFKFCIEQVKIYFPISE